MLSYLQRLCIEAGGFATHPDGENFPPNLRGAVLAHRGMEILGQLLKRRIAAMLSLFLNGLKNIN